MRERRRKKRKSRSKIWKEHFSGDEARTWDILSQYLDYVVWFGTVVCCRGNCVLTVQSNVCMKVVRSIVELGRGERGREGRGREGRRGKKVEGRKRQEKQKGRREGKQKRGRRGNNVQNSVITSREILKQDIIPLF